MTLSVRGYRLPRQYAAALDRVEKTAEVAVQLVCSRIGVRLDHTKVIVTTGQMTSDVLIDAHRALFGGQPAIWDLKRRYRGVFGVTTIDKTGILVVISADRRQSIGELDRTLVHELVHAAQFSKPGGRDAVARNLRNNYAIDRMSSREARAANRQVAADEREAARLENLALELPA